MDKRDLPEEYRYLVESLKEVNTMGGKYALVFVTEYDWASDGGIYYADSLEDIVNYLRDFHEYITA